METKKLKSAHNSFTVIICLNKKWCVIKNGFGSSTQFGGLFTPPTEMCCESDCCGKANFCYSRSQKIRKFFKHHF